MLIDIKSLEEKKTAISVTGLGYVGLPLALAFAHRYRVIGFDHNEERVAMLRQGEDPSHELTREAFEDADILFTSDAEDLREASVHIVATPTPIDSSCVPDISLLLSAAKTLSLRMKEGDIVVVESTVYPGCTEEDFLPVLEDGSRLKVDTDFGLAYSPERINPGDKVHTFSNVTKIVSARTAEALAVVSALYSSVVTAGVYNAQSIRVAEAAKIIENTQRDVNIALMNELSLIFSRMGIDTGEVIDAASTKWNFLPFRPGLVGGHCIGVDPYYLDYKARELGYFSQVIKGGRYVNDSMGHYVAKQTVKQLIARGVPMSKARVLIMGLTYKENVADVRNSRSIDILDELRSFSVGQVDVVDPEASKRDSLQIYGFEPQNAPEGTYDAIIVAVAHDSFTKLDENFFRTHLRSNGLLVDVKGIYKNSITGIDMWRL